VPKREIFDRSDFPDTIKSLRVGDFGVKIKNFFKSFGLKKNFSVAFLGPLVNFNKIFLEFLGT
jgi:hypothetical protein